MAEHAIHIERLGPKFFAVCACTRWRSKGYETRENAEDAGDAHVVRGDEHNRALAALQRGGGTLASELKWYEEQAVNPLNAAEDRRMWAMLANDLRPRVKSASPSGDDQPLFS